MNTLKLFIVTIGLIAVVSCNNKKNLNPESTHPFAGTVRLYETKRNLKLNYYNNGANAQFSISLGTDALIEFLPGTQKNQYYIRPKDHPEWCLDVQAKNEYYAKLYSYFGNNSQLFNVIDIGDNKIKIQSTADTSLYLLNDSDDISVTFSTYLKPRNYDAGALDFWVIEKL